MHTIILIDGEGVQSSDDNILASILSILLINDTFLFHIISCIKMRCVRACVRVCVLKEYIFCCHAVFK